MDILKILKDNRALLEGHFLLSSGLHSDRYIQCARLLQYPALAAEIALELVEKLKKKESGFRADVVVSPAIGGIVLGQEVARALSCRSIFTERENGIMSLRRGFEIKKNEKCLVAEDVITTGGSTREVIELVNKVGGIVSGVVSVIDRSELEDFAVSLIKLSIKTYGAFDCELCRNGIPLVKPGSKKW